GDRRRPFVAAIGQLRQRVRLVLGQRGTRHAGGPVLQTAVPNKKRPRRAERQSVADATEDLGPILLDLLARAAAVALLPTGEVRRDRVLGPSKARRDALDGDAEGGSMRLARSEEAERGHSAAATAGSPVGSPSAERRPPARASPSFDCISSSGAGWPVHNVNAAAPWWRSISSPSRVVAPAACASRSNRVLA